MGKLAGMALILILLFTVGDIISIGLSSRKPFIDVSPNCSSTTNIQCGSVTFTLTATTINSQTITFSPAFASTPNSFTLGPPPLWPTVSLAGSAPLATYCMICPTNTGQSFVWANMPAATTEIFGDANRENQILTTSPFSGTSVAGGNFRVSVDCNTGSNSATAVLEVQWSTDDATWNDLANTPGNGDVAIDAAAHCLAPGTILKNTLVDPVPINTSFPASSGLVYLRLVGKNGGGIGDAPAFAWFNLTIRGLTSGTNIPCITDKTALSATSVTVRLRCPLVTTVTVTFTWTAIQ